MRFSRFGLVSLATVPIAIILNVDVGFPSRLLGSGFDWQLIQPSQVLAQTPEERKAEADRLFNQGIEQFQTSQFEAALQSWQQALIIVRAINDRLGEGAALGNLGIAYSSLGDYTQAIEYYQQHLAIAREIKDRSGEGQSLGNLGNAYGSLGDYAQAIEYLQQSLEIAREISDRFGEGRTLGNLGTAYRSLGDYAQAIDYQQQSLEIAREINNRRGEGLALGNLGTAYGSLGDYAQAIEYYQQSLEIAQEINDRDGEGKALGGLGNAYDSLGDYAQAIEYYQQSLEIAREISNRQGEGLTLGNLGTAYYFLGDYAQAIDYHQQSLAIAQEIKDRRGEGRALNNLGSTYHALGDYSQAIEYKQQSLAIAREIKNRLGEGGALGNLGSTYHNLGDYSQAIEYHQQYLAIAREINDRDGEGLALGNLGTSYGSLGDYAQAIEYHQQSLVIAQEIKDRRGEGYALGSLGNAYDALGDYSQAIEYHQQSLAIVREIKDRHGEGYALGNLGLAYDALGDYSQAIEYQQQSLAIVQEIKDRHGEGNALGSLGNAYDALGDYSQAIEYHQQYLAIAREIQDRDGEGTALNNLGVALFNSGNLVAAEETLFDGIRVWESLRSGLGNNDAFKVSIFEKQASTYRTLQQVLIAQNKTDTALEIAERGRARAFVELLQQRLLAADWAAVLKADVTDGVSRNSDNPTSATSVTPSVANIKEIAQQQNATLVEYSIISDTFKVEGKEQFKESELYIWVIKPTGEITFRSVDLKPLWQKDDISLDELVYISRDAMNVRGLQRASVRLRPGFEQKHQANQTEQLQQLHQLLIQPIADLLPTNPEERVIFMPQSSLFLVPFPALQDEEGNYLIEKHTILTAPAIQVLQLTREQRKKNQEQEIGNRESLVVGNPKMPSVRPDFDKPPEPLTPLPGAEQEAKAIAPLLNTQPLIGSQATETAIKQRLTNAQFIHLATHGLLDDIRGIGSAIALTPSDSDDGLLTADEILNLDLNAELVVLSACDTGRGRITGDGVVGLSRSLISAGTASVVVSLWQVPDDSTAFLMTQFYQNLQQNQDKAQALRQAMLTTMKQYPQPLQWAAFTLIGEAE
ncbi:CHAT domain-containing tetratricopeptide repeat protein [Coleofasciculus sp. LEGE 07092]|uniref:CHAT domain-containing tetratricopeptide repeat protein n=1 Tax=Coleofasciculus sp. LEGE 07092 TaxID=2777969 RepID=UPI00187FE1E8|nr:CHAT domain-containing protein [Coleofasciculus sp. LEGE 07092]MBE9148014.1 tetratricopeptide repeat protein [Coleofasciculus sp. LEGE 07092]